MMESRKDSIRVKAILTFVLRLFFSCGMIIGFHSFIHEADADLSVMYNIIYAVFLLLILIIPEVFRILRLRKIRLRRKQKGK
jgi:Ca2+/Na+ antiporter